MQRSLTLFTISLFLSQLLSAQTVKHHSFTTYYNAQEMQPDSVSWVLTPEMVACEGKVRKDKFSVDPEIPGSVKPSAYKNTGYDKGHLFSWDSAKCSEIDDRECFYMSNMIPQPHPLNSGDWSTLEKQERRWAAIDTIYVIAGGFGSKGVLPSGVNIPESCWKAIYFQGKWRGWIMPNEKTSKGHKYGYWEVLDIKRFGRIVGLSF